MSTRVCYARSRTFATDLAYHCPPRAVATPRAFKADAISLRVVAPAFWASRMIGSTLAANLSASAVTGHRELGITKGHPASLCRRESLPGPCRDKRAFPLACSEQVKDERVYIGSKLRDQERHLVGQSSVSV